MLADCVQFAAAHAIVIKTIHLHIDTPTPVMIGFLKLTEYPSPARASVIFSTSLPCYKTHPDQEVRNHAQKYKKTILAAEVGGPLADTAGRCVENSTFLRYVGYSIVYSHLSTLQPSSLALRLSTTHQ